MPEPKLLRSDGAGGSIVACHVQPGASRTALAGRYGERLKIALQAPPVDGRANKALCRFIAQKCGVAASAVRVERGVTGRDKEIRILGVPPEQAAPAMEIELERI